MNFAETAVNIFKNMSPESHAVIVVTLVVMLGLFLVDLFSKHKDFKSILVSIGVLGTFIGISIGLVGFDSVNVSNSVPKLLDGLKTAFITSIAGMFLAILLSIIQKFKKGDGVEDEITALSSINEKLTNLNDIKKHTEILPLINTKLDSIDTNIKSLSGDISSVKTELKTNQKDLFEFLKDKLSGIDNSLKEAVQTLSKGATEEIIKALENVIQDFNKNLSEQFGDNFKQLNEAVLNMIKWQESYKDSVVEFEKQLKQTMESTTVHQQKTIEIINNFAKTNQEELKILVNSNTDNIEKINYATTENTNTLMERISGFSDEINNSLKENVEQNQQANEKTKESLAQLFKQTQEAVSTTEDNAKRIKEIAESYENIVAINKKVEAVLTSNENQIQTLKSHFITFTEISENAKGITKELESFSNGIQGSLTNQSQALAKLTQEIEKKLPDSLEELNKSLTTLTKQFRADYEIFLKQISELMQANNIN